MATTNKPALGTAKKAQFQQKQTYELSQLLPKITQTLTKSPQVAIATTQAIQNGANPLSLAMAKEQLGDQDYIGYCEAFVEKTQTGHTGIYPSASDAWNQQQDKAVPGLEGVQPGDAVYLNDPSNPSGHTGIYSGDNQFISATDNGVQQNDLNQWQKNTGQQVMGYIPQGGPQ